MKIYLTISSIPELAVLPKRIRKYVWWDFFQNKVFWKWQSWLWLLCFGLITWLAGAGLIYLDKVFPNLPSYALPIFSLITSGFLGVIFLVTTFTLLRPSLRDFLKAKKPDQPFSEYLFQSKVSNQE